MNRKTGKQENEKNKVSKPNQNKNAKCKLYKPFSRDISVFDK